MIERIGSDNYINPYVKNSVKPKSNEQAPAFLLNYDETGVIYDKNDKLPTGKEKNKKDNETEFRAEKREGFKENAEGVKKKEESGDFLKSARIILGKIKGIWQKVFNFIWYGNDIEEAKGKEKEVNKASDDTDAYYKNNSAKLARNTTILTQYNRFGQISEPPVSEMNLILKGDKSKKI